MGCRVFVGREAGAERESACLFDSVTGWVFGPLFADEAEAAEFIAWSRRDPRAMTDDELGQVVVRFRAQSAAT